MLGRDRELLGPLVARAKRLLAEKPDESAALVLAAASAVKDDAGFLEDASQILRQTGRAAESKVLLGRSLGVRAALALQGGDPGKALKLADQATERDPSVAHFLIAARAAASLGMREAAVENVGAAVAAGPVDAAAIRADPVLSKLLPDSRLEDLLERAARRSGENHGKAVPR
jgi:hypothetical protein